MTVQMTCLDLTHHLTKEYVFASEKIAFPYMDEDHMQLSYTFEGNMARCAYTSNHCEWTSEIKATLLDPDVYQVYEGRQDLHGVYRDAPKLYHTAIRDEHELEVWIPVWNYFSGHDLSFKLDVNEAHLPDGVNETSVVFEKYTSYEETMSTLAAGAFDLELFKADDGQWYVLGVPAELKKVIYIYRETKDELKDLVLVREIETDFKIGKGTITEFTDSDGKVRKIYIGEEEIKSAS